MACGTPACVGAETAAGCPEARDVLLCEVTGVEDSAARWGTLIEALIASPSPLEAMRPLVAAFAREHWSWERCAARYAEVLRACATR
jgi:glycosyltransferase involved in cell wall biosynthesis